MKDKFIGKKINSERIYIRLIEEQDASYLYRWLLDEETRKLTESSESSFDETVELVKEWINDPNIVEFIIVDKSNNEPIGDITLRLDTDDNNKAEFGTIIGEKGYRGKGYVRESVDALISELKREKCLKELYFEILLVNEPSIKLFKYKFGWKETHRDEKQAYFSHLLL